MYYYFKKIYIGSLAIKHYDECYTKSQNIICTIDRHGIATDLLTGKQYNFYDHDHSVLAVEDIVYVNALYEGNQLFNECAEIMGTEFIFRKEDLYRLAKLLSRHIDITIPCDKEDIANNRKKLVKRVRC